MWSKWGCILGCPISSGSKATMSWLQMWDKFEGSTNSMHVYFILKTPSDENRDISPRSPSSSSHIWRNEAAEGNYFSPVSYQLMPCRETWGSSSLSSGEGDMTAQGDYFSSKSSESSRRSKVLIHVLCILYFRSGTMLPNNGLDSFPGNIANCCVINTNVVLKKSNMDEPLN